LCHNHPSGNLKPSQPDRELTKKIKEAARLFDINLLDHIIVSQDGYFSFADEGLI
jgi:DNA repair protein RadC